MSYTRQQLAIIDRGTHKVKYFEGGECDVHDLEYMEKTGPNWEEVWDDQIVKHLNNGYKLIAVNGNELFFAKEIELEVH